MIKPSLCSSFVGNSSHHGRSDGSISADYGAQSTQSLGHKGAPLTSLKPQTNKVGTLPRRRDTGADGGCFFHPSTMLYYTSSNSSGLKCNKLLASFAKWFYLPSTSQPTRRPWSPYTVLDPAWTARGQLQPRTPLRSAWWPSQRWSDSIWLPGAAQHQHLTGPPWAVDLTRGLAQIPL